MGRGGGEIGQGKGKLRGENSENVHTSSTCLGTSVLGAIEGAEQEVRFDVSIAIN